VPALVRPAITFAERVLVRLTGRRGPLLLALLAALLASPSLNVGLLFDDYAHQLAIQGREGFLGALGTRWNPFKFWDGDPEHTRVLMDHGITPWWTYPGIKATLWRPVTVLTHHLDYWLWPDWPVLMHVQSILWFAGAIAVVALLFREVLGRTWPAGVAALLYTVDNAHAVPVAWIANRNTLLAVLFGVLSILAHVRWRSRASPRWMVVAFLAFVLSLLAKEEGIATTAYLFAFAVFLDRDSWRRRAASLLPYAVLLVGWRLAWALAGGGIEGVGPYAYVDPLSKPLLYLRNVLAWGPPMLWGQWGLPPAEATFLFGRDGPHWPLWCATVLLLLTAGTLMTPYLWRNRTCGFFLVGMVLSLLPVCAGIPGDRMLFFPGIGGMGLLATFFHVLRSAAPHPALSSLWRRAAGALSIFFIVVHGILAPVLLSIGCAWPFGPKSLLEQVMVRVPEGVDVENKDVIVVNLPFVLFAAYLPITRALAGQPLPRCTRILSPSFAAVTLTRTDRRTLRVRPDPSYFAVQMDRLFRSQEYPFAVGDRVELSGVTVEVQELDGAHRPSEVDFHFAVDLDDASLVWIRWRDGSFVEFRPPAVHERVELPAAIPKFF